jgi:hypothetical protein
MSNDEGTQKVFVNVNLNFKLTIATVQVHFENSPTLFRLKNGLLAARLLT